MCRARGGRKSKPTGYTGKLLEADIFGVCRAECTGGQNEYVEFWPAVIEVERNQPGDPTSPHSRPINALRVLIADELGVEEREVGFFTAVGSALDLFHKVDGFFKWGRVVAFIDITLDLEGKKPHGTKFFVTESDFYTEDHEINAKRLRELAYGIATFLQQRRPDKQSETEIHPNRLRMQSAIK
ncbi:MAG: hypothetical protein Q8O87_01200 [bacterium]|nr:hypothetical protein [bacterium]